MSLDQLLAAYAGTSPPSQDQPIPDTSEQVSINSLALLKMLRHGRSGVPFEVMGLLLGDFVDDYTIRVVDTFAMPQSGTSVSVESVDHAYQTEMMNMLKQTGRAETVVGWYHSHPGFDCWLSATDQSTHQSFQTLAERAVAVVVDPLLSVKGKVCIDAFRLVQGFGPFFDPSQDTRQTTSVLATAGAQEPSFRAFLTGIDRTYYNIIINFKHGHEVEQEMLKCLHKKPWNDGLVLKDCTAFNRYVQAVYMTIGKYDWGLNFEAHLAHSSNDDAMKQMASLAQSYCRSAQEEEHLSSEELAIKYVGKTDPKRRLEQLVERTMTDNIEQALVGIVNTVAFT